MLVGYFKLKPTADAVRREAMLVAVLNTLIARKGGTLTTNDNDHFTVWRLGKGAIFVHRKATENAGEDCLIVQTYQLN